MSSNRKRKRSPDNGNEYSGGRDGKVVVERFKRKIGVLEGKSTCVNADTSRDSTTIVKNVSEKIGTIKPGATSTGLNLTAGSSRQEQQRQPESTLLDLANIKRDLAEFKELWNKGLHFCAPAIPNDFDLEELKHFELTDGRINVKVEPCGKDFFEEKKDSAYVMQRRIRGKALIINVSMAGAKRERKGTDVDRDNLTALWQQLHFEVVVYNDVDGLSLEGMQQKLQQFAKKVNLKKTEACVVSILSHGALDGVESTDGKVLPYAKIISTFDNCKNLVGKPKLFIFQACRGAEIDLGITLDETDHPSSIPIHSDKFVWYATQEDFVAVRNKQTGSWFITAIVQAFMAHAKKEDISALSYLVHAAVCRKVRSIDGTKQAPDCRQTLRKKWFFFPGIAQ